MLTNENNLIINSESGKVFTLNRVSGLKDPEFGKTKEIHLNILGKEVKFLAEKISDGRFRAPTSGFLKAIGINYLYF